MYSVAVTNISPDIQVISEEVLYEFLDNEVPSELGIHRIVGTKLTLSEALTSYESILDVAIKDIMSLCGKKSEGTYVDFHKLMQWIPDDKFLFLVNENTIVGVLDDTTKEVDISPVSYLELFQSDDIKPCKFKVSYRQFMAEFSNSFIFHTAFSGLRCEVEFLFVKPINEDLPRFFTNVVIDSVKIVIPDSFTFELSQKGLSNAIFRGLNSAMNFVMFHDRNWLTDSDPDIIYQRVGSLKNKCHIPDYVLNELKSGGHLKGCLTTLDLLRAINSLYGEVKCFGSQYQFNKALNVATSDNVSYAWK
jgi:hypothetical protein